MILLDIQYMLGNLSFACLLAMVVWYWIKLTFSLNPSLAPVGTVGMATANLSLAGLLLARWFTSGHFPLSNLYESLLFLSWGFTAFHLIMEIISRSDLFGIVTSPVALLTHAFASFSLPKEMQKTTALVPALQSNWLMMHVTVMMISYVALISGSLLALAFLVVNYYDKKTLEKASPALGGLKNYSPGSEQGSARDRIGEEDHYVLTHASGQSRLNMLEKGTIKHLLGQCVHPCSKEQEDLQGVAAIPSGCNGTALPPLGVPSDGLAGIVGAKNMTTPPLAFGVGPLPPREGLALGEGAHMQSNPLGPPLGDHPPTSLISVRPSLGTDGHPTATVETNLSLKASIGPGSLPPRWPGVANESLGGLSLTGLTGVRRFTERGGASLAELESSARGKGKASRSYLSSNQADETLNNGQVLPVPGASPGAPFSPFAQTLDNLSYRTLGLGFPLLTIGILSGAVWANEAWGSYWSWDPKETWALITWLVFAIYLHTRLSKGWRGNKPAFIAVAGFFLVWICYLGVNLLGTGLHSYGWFQARG